MRKNTIFLVLAVILLMPILSFAASDAAPDVERMAGLARLWGGVKFSFPHLSSGDIDWDAALIRALPRVRAARTSEAYRKALDDLLAELGDPATRLLAQEPTAPAPSPETANSAPAGPRQPFVKKTEDGIAILTATDSTQFADDSQTWIQMFSDFQKAFEKAAEAELVLVDLRALRGTPGFLFNMTVPRFFPRLLGRDVPLPPTRFLSHSGYPSQREATFAYHSDLCVRSGGVIRAQGRGLAVPGRIVVLINRDSSDFSHVLHALQQSGAAVVIGEGEPNPEAGIVTRTLELPDGLKARIRCAELLRGDGGTGFRPALSVPDSALRMGLELLRGERDWPRPAAEPPAAPAGPSGFSVAEKAYPEMDVPSRDFRMLALFRFWNVIENFYPYKDLMDHDWGDILTEFIPRMDAAENARSYVLTLAELVARIQDSHGTLTSPVLTDYFGTHTPALRVDSVEGWTVVTRIADTALEDQGLAKGDILTAVDGEPTGVRRERLARFTPASTPGRLKGLVDMRILAGAENSPAVLVFEKSSGKTLSLEVPRTIPGFALYRESSALPVFAVLPEGFGYIDIGRLKTNEVVPALEKIGSCPGLVLDMRGYPVGGNMLLGQILARKRTAFARLYFPEYDGATGTFRTREELQYLDPLPGPAFEGPIVMLVHGGTQSAAEHTSLMLEAVRDVIFVGNPSSGADGNITYTVLPGGISVGFTGMGVRHGDGRQLQRMGIQPHVTARPTLSGIRSGRDEVLEKAVEVLRSRTDRNNEDMN